MHVSILFWRHHCCRIICIPSKPKAFEDFLLVLPFSAFICKFRQKSSLCGNMTATNSDACKNKSTAQYKSRIWTYHTLTVCSSDWTSYSSPAVPCKPESASFLHPEQLFVLQTSNSLPATGFGRLHLSVHYKGGERRALNKPAIQAVHTTVFHIIIKESQ